MKVAVLGAGISGLTTAFLLGRTHAVTVFEAGARPGGNIFTGDLEGCRVEWGPNGFLDNEPATLRLAEELDLTPRLRRAREAASRRFIWRAGKLRELPASPGRFLTSGCLPLRARLRVLLEPWAGKPPPGDESVHAFATRRIGRGAADSLVDAFVTGVYAGDPHRLSVKSAFPKLAQLEAEYGSLIKGAKGRGFGPKGVLTSFDSGLSVLIEALASRVDLRLESPWKEIARGGFDRVICTAPAPKAAGLMPEPLKSLLASIPCAPVAVVALVFREPLKVPEVFGFLVPGGEELRILGALYDSSIFPGRAPEGLRLFRVMAGGRRDPEAMALCDDALIEIAARDLRRAWGFFPAPLAARVIRHPLGIAQYELGHAALLGRIEATCPDWLRLMGSSYRGVAINACVKEAYDLRLD